MDGEPIEVIDRYQIVARLGKGGMAEVFRAKLQSIGGFERDVALKVLLPSFAAEPEFVEMLLDEARIAGSIDHPNVLQVIDVGRKAEIFYLVMEYVDGRDLRSIAKSIPGGRIPLGMALYIISEMLRGLSAVHTAMDERGQPRRIVHRDISPGNVMVDRRGFVKLGDFGIAHASGRITKTRVGSVKGKSRYMAPEQLAGTPIDHRADLYAVGVTLFEAILGDFARNSSRPTIYGPMFTWPERLPDGALPPDVEAILRRAITDSPDLRYRDAAEFRQDLELALHRWAPGYSADTLARELMRVGASPSGKLPLVPDTDSTQRAPGREPAVGVQPVRWRGVPTAQNMPDGTGTSRSELTPVQRFAELTPSGMVPALPAEIGMQTSDAPALVSAPALPPEFLNPMETRPRTRIDRRLGWGLLIGALAVVTVGIAAAVASSGSVVPLPTAEELHAPSSPSPPQATALPQRGAIEVRGPSGADILIGSTYYGTAPSRIELPVGDYVIGLRYGKKHRVTQHQAHVTAGQTTQLR
jgi:serine/threonine protein kinase